MRSTKCEVREGGNAFELCYPLVGRGVAGGVAGGVRREPFPTLYWLRDPDACRRMGELERRGGVREVERRIAADVRRRHAFAKDHARYRDTRWETLTPADRAWVRAQPALRAALAGGIGGIADFARVKCLHLHWAHHLAVGGTTAGRVIEGLAADL